MKDIQERVFNVIFDEAKLECLCDILFNNYPDGVVVKILEVQGIASHNFKKDFLTDISSEIHEQISNELTEKNEYYDEQDR